MQEAAAKSPFLPEKFAQNRRKSAKCQSFFEKIGLE